jgi:hypothetical protein
VKLVSFHSEAVIIVAMSGSAEAARRDYYEML